MILILIESLAGDLYIYNRIGIRWIDNYDIWLQDLITCIALTSIFYTLDGSVHNSVDYSKMPDISGYDRIYTLNYYKFWDAEKKAHYLHGKIDLDLTNKERDALKSLLKKNNYSFSRNLISEYAEVIKDMVREDRDLHDKDDTLTSDVRWGCN